MALLLNKRNFFICTTVTRSKQIKFIQAPEENQYNDIVLIGTSLDKPH